MFVVFSLASSILLTAVNSQAFCTTNNGSPLFCLYSKDLGTQVEFQLESFQPVGWMGVGLGSSMSSAEIYVAWADSKNNVILSRRTSTRQGDPVVESNQIQQVVSSKVSNGKISVVFRRDKQISATGAQVSITGSKTPMIWAWTPSVPDSDSPSASIAYHGNDRRGVNPAVDLFAASSAFAGQDPSAAPVSSSGSSLLVAHMVLLAFAWCVAAPAGVFIARFLKNALGGLWFKLHIGLMLVGCTLLGLVGVVCVIVYAGGIDIQKYSTVGVIHVVVGLLVTFLSIVQVVSGFVIDKLFNPQRKEIPWYDKAHWWAGRIATSGGFINVAFGFVLRGMGTAIFVLYGLWTALVLALFTFLTFRYGQTHDHETEHEMSPTKEGYVKMQDPIVQI